MFVRQRFLIELQTEGVRPVEKFNDYCLCVCVCQAGRPVDRATPLPLPLFVHKHCTHTATLWQMKYRTCSAPQPVWCKQFPHTTLVLFADLILLAVCVCCCEVITRPFRILVPSDCWLFIISSFTLCTRSVQSKRKQQQCWTVIDS